MLKASHRQAAEGQGRLGVAGTQRGTWAWQAQEIAKAQNVGCASGATCPAGPVMCGVCFSGACLRDASRSLIPTAILAPGHSSQLPSAPTPTPALGLLRSAGLFSHHSLFFMLETSRIRQTFRSSELALSVPVFLSWPPIRVLPSSSGAVVGKLAFEKSVIREDDTCDGQDWR